VTAPIGRPAATAKPPAVQLGTPVHVYGPSIPGDWGDDWHLASVASEVLTGGAAHVVVDVLVHLPAPGRADGLMEAHRLQVGVFGDRGSALAGDGWVGTVAALP
jgi:hypothetical protein